MCLLEGEQLGSGRTGTHSYVFDSVPLALSSIVHPEWLKEGEAVHGPLGAWRLAPTHSLCPHCPHSFGGDSDFES